MMVPIPTKSERTYEPRRAITRHHSNLHSLASPVSKLSEMYSLKLLRARNLLFFLQRVLRGLERAKFRRPEDHGLL